MARIGAFFFLSVVVVADLLATKWKVEGYEHYAPYSTWALLIGLLLAAISWLGDG